MVNKIEELEKIKSLKDKGSITEQEYEIEKQKILNSDENNSTKTEGIYTASLVLGICSFLFAGIPILGLILSIIGLIISIKSRKKLKANNETKGIVTAGFILSIIGLIISIITFVFVLSIGIAFMEGENGILTSANISRLETKEVEIPNVVGLSVEQAQEEVEKNNLIFEIEKEEYNKDVEEGYVISQNPTYYIEGFNQVKENSTISVVVSKGQEKVKVPKVVGMKTEEAIKTLEKVNLKVQVVEETSKVVEGGYVISQETDPDTDVFEGDTVIIHVSTMLNNNDSYSTSNNYSNDSNSTFNNNYSQETSSQQDTNNANNSNQMPSNWNTNVLIPNEFKVSYNGKVCIADSNAYSRFGYNGYYLCCLEEPKKNNGAKEGAKYYLNGKSLENGIFKESRGNRYTYKYTFNNIKNVTFKIVAPYLYDVDSEKVVKTNVTVFEKSYNVVELYNNRHDSGENEYIKLEIPTIWGD